MTTDESYEISDEGIAIIESGLSLRHAHELKTGCSARDLCTECRHAIGEVGP